MALLKEDKSMDIGSTYLYLGHLSLILFLHMVICKLVYYCFLLIYFVCSSLVYFRIYNISI